VISRQLFAGQDLKYSLVNILLVFYQMNIANFYKGVPMKKILLVMLIVLFSAVSVFCGEFEDTLKKAKQGDASAQAVLGLMYAKGRGVAQDYKQAVHWWSKAAEQGDAVAQNSLGTMYASGRGIAQDYKQAFHWHTKAAEQGYAWAQFSLGVMYENGEGVTQDYKQAVHWYTKAAEQGLASVQFSLGVMYENGEGVVQDYKQAVHWWSKAAEQGFASARFNLGLMYDKGQGVTQDYKQAVYWYTKAAEQGYASAQYNLGGAYAKGQGVAQDYKQAVHWWSKAAEQGDASAQYNLGLMYYDGKGITQNFKLAYVWESLAAAQGHESAIKNRDITAKKLSPQQLTEAQDLAAQIQKKIDNPTKSQKQEPSIANTEKKINGSGTGFIITKDGYILTCHHVIKGAAKIEIAIEGKIYPATLVRDDPNNDLALLKIDGSFPAIGFSSDRSAKMGQAVFTIGYPNPGLQGVSAKFTEGTINSLTGFQDDMRLYQISIPVQPGNSGGALLDENGNVLGVIVAMLDAKTTFKITGSLPQNVNYAVKILYAQAMIDTLPEISGKLISPARNKTNAIENAQKSTVMVICYD